MPESLNEFMHGDLQSEGWGWGWGWGSGSLTDIHHVIHQQRTADGQSEACSEGWCESCGLVSPEGSSSARGWPGFWRWTRPESPSCLGPVDLQLTHRARPSATWWQVSTTKLRHREELQIEKILPGVEIFHVLKFQLNTNLLLKQWFPH